MENMMITPAIYQDIPSSFMMSPMPVMPMMPMYGYGMSPMRPVLADDKFEKLQTKKEETKKTAKTTAIVLGALAIGGWILSKRVKLKTPQFLTNLKPKLQNGYQQVKTAVPGGLDKIKNLFKKKKP